MAVGAEDSATRVLAHSYTTEVLFVDSSMRMIGV
jgi:hypothetical protein